MANNNERNDRMYRNRDRSISPRDRKGRVRSRSPRDPQRGNENRAGANNRNKSQGQSHSRSLQQERERNERLRAVLNRVKRESAARGMNDDRNQAQNQAQPRAARRPNSNSARSARPYIPNSARTSNDWIADREQQRRARRNNYGRADNPVVIEDDEQEDVPRPAAPLLRNENREAPIVVQDAPRARIAAAVPADVAPADVAPADVAPADVAPADVAPAAPIVDAPVVAPVVAPVAVPVAARVAPRVPAPVAPRVAVPVPVSPIRAFAVRRRPPPVFHPAPAGYNPQPLGLLRPNAPVFFAAPPVPQDDIHFPPPPPYMGPFHQPRGNVIMEPRNFGGGMFARRDYGEPPGILYYDDGPMERAHYFYDPPAHPPVAPAHPPVAPAHAPAHAPARPAVVAPADEAPADEAPGPPPDRRRLQEYNVLPVPVNLGFPHEWTRIHDESLATLLRARIEVHTARWLAITNANNGLRDAHPNHHHLAPPEPFESDTFTDPGDDDEELDAPEVPEGEHCNTCMDRRANVQFNCRGRVGGEPHSACTRCVMEIWRAKVGMGRIERDLNPLASYLVCPVCRAHVTQLTADNELGEFSEAMVAGRYVPVVEGQETEWVSIRPWIARRSQRYAKRIERQVGGGRGRRAGWAPY
ncbi:uncharacterized protein H6S33_008506 [Morchella sextelata]|uniref:uncharacterized protein n=1 Tax=Morchella sextelata TaxID=1174677 RepID=UPI001D0569C8|nr:uncharacterized protein H6S33_008506 [Morchella sextelata]KAH0602856.1 hypothetical protein H6S33_008506 [Morchella sextelata]